MPKLKQQSKTNRRKKKKKKHNRLHLSSPHLNYVSSHVRNPWALSSDSLKFRNFETLEPDKTISQVFKEAGVYARL